MPTAHHDLIPTNVPSTTPHKFATQQSRLEPLPRQPTGLLTTLPTPVQRVPPEVLGEIFLYAPTSQMRPRNYQATVARVSLVCRHWRGAALLTPQLWCDVWLRADSPSLMYEAISTWSSRAGRGPRHLEVSAIHCGGINPFYGAEICAENTSTCVFAKSVFCQLLKRSPSKWSSVTIDCPAWECLQHFIALLDLAKDHGDHGWDSIQSLEVVTTRWCVWPDDDDYEPLFHFLPPSVANLILRLPNQHEIGFSLDCWVYPLQIPHSNLRHLTSFELSFGDFLEIYYHALFATLGHCEALETLRIDFSFADLIHLDPQSTYPSIVLPNLRHLDLGQVNWPFDCLKKIKMPLLRELRISFSEKGDGGGLGTVICSVGDPKPHGTYDGQELSDFIRGGEDTNTQLCSLHINAVCLHNDTLFHILRDLSALKHLRLECIQFLPTRPEVDDFAKLMAHTPPCVPNLTKLEVLNLKRTDYREIGSLDSFVEERGIELTLTCHSHPALREPEEDFGSQE